MNKYVLILLILLVTLKISSQTIITSKIINKLTNEPIQNANIFFKKNASIGTFSDSLGNFKLKITDTSDMCIITCIGFEKNELSIKQISHLKQIELEPKFTELGEVFISNNIEAKKIIEISLEKFKSNYLKKKIVANFEFSNYSFKDSFKTIEDTITIIGNIHFTSYNNYIYKDSLEISNYYLSTKFDSLCFIPSLLIFGEKNNKQTSFVKKNIQTYIHFLYAHPSLLTEVFFPNFIGHYYFIDSICNNRTWAISIKNIKGYNNYHNLPEEEFRNMFSENLIAFKKKISYSPNSNIFRVSEHQLDSIFFANLRKQMKYGNRQNVSMTLIINKENFIIEKSIFHICSVLPNGIIETFTNFSIDYFYLNKYKKIIANRIDVFTKNKHCNYNISAHFKINSIVDGKNIIPLIDDFTKSY